MDANKYQEIAYETSGVIDTDTLVLGLCKEAGLIAGLFETHKRYKTKLEKEKVIKELGFLCWYVANLALDLGISFEGLLDDNVEKLKEKYPFAVEVINEILENENEEEE